MILGDLLLSLFFLTNLETLSIFVDSIMNYKISVKN